MGLRKNEKGRVKDAKKRGNNKRTRKKIFATRPKGRFVSFLSQFVGAILAIVAGAMFGLMCLRSVFYGISLTMDAFLFLFLCVIGFVLYYNGRRVRKLLTRFRFYRRYLEGRESITLDELSGLTGRKVEFLRQDLKKMLDRKLFVHGRMDKQEVYLFLTEDAYEAYAEISGEAAEYEEEQVYEDVREEEPVYEGFYKEVQYERAPVKEDGPQDYDIVPPSFIDVAGEYLTFYEGMQKKLKAKTIQKIVTDFGVYTVRILAHEIENGDRERFLRYYLPVTKKLLLTYEEMEKEGIAENAGDLEDILNTIRYSFQTFVEKLAEGRGMDVETDILALDMMLSRI